MNGIPSCPAQRTQRLVVGPPNQLDQVRGGKLPHADDGDPVISPSIAGRLHARDIGELDESIGIDANAEAPSFRDTGLEIREFLSTDMVDEKIVRLAVERVSGTRKPAAERLQLADVHERSSRYDGGLAVEAGAELTITVEMRSKGGWVGVFKLLQSNDHRAPAAEPRGFGR